jgi:hypothetical protein
MSCPKKHARNEFAAHIPKESPMTDKKIELLTELAKLPPHELAKLQVLAKHLGEFSKLTPQERARVLAKAERAGAVLLAKAQSSR